MTRYVITKKYMYLSKDFKGIREILDRCLVDYLCLRSLWESLLRSAKAFFDTFKEHQGPSHVVSVQHTYNTKTHSFLYFPGVIVTCWICQYTIYTQKPLLNCYSFIKAKSKENLILWKLRVFVRQPILLKSYSCFRASSGKVIYILYLHRCNRIVNSAELIDLWCSFCKTFYLFVQEF